MKITSFDTTKISESCDISNQSIFNLRKHFQGIPLNFFPVKQVKRD